MNSTNYTIILDDKTSYSVPINILKGSGLLKTMIDVCDQSNEVTIPKIKTEYFTKIIEYLTYHYDADNENTLLTNSEITDWDNNYCNHDIDFLIEFVECVNFFAIDSLLKLVCSTIQSQIACCKSIDELRTKLHIINDFTQEEEDKIKKEIGFIIDYGRY